MASWNSFTAFEGGCILDKSVFAAKTDFEFVEWVKKLRANPFQGGIPRSRVGDVDRLLNKFFPAGSHTVHVAFSQPSLLDPNVVPSPETVTYGASQITINDGPSALGYIFSIAASNAGSPRTYINYAVPLLAIYARCLFLAYISAKGSQHVPFMANCMYTILGEKEPIFPLLLGSTYQILGELQDSKLQMMNRFRRGIVDGGLVQFNPPRILPLEPRLSNGAALALKKYLRGVLPSKADAILEIPGSARAAPPSSPISDSTAKKMFNELVSDWYEQWKETNETEIGSIELHEAVTCDALTVAGGSSVKLAIERAVKQMVKKRWEADYDRAKAWEDMYPLLREFYLQIYIPHMFPARSNPREPPTKPRKPTTGSTKRPPRSDLDGPAAKKPKLKQLEGFAPKRGPKLPKPDTTKPQVTMPEWEATAKKKIDDILRKEKDWILDKLDHIYSWISNGDPALSDGGPDRPRYGRCAETHPVVSLLRNYIPERAKTSPVRGFAFQILRFGNEISEDTVTCNDLSLDFSRDTLNALNAAISNNPVYRLPCENCKILLKEMDAPIGPDAYDADLKALDPSNFHKVK